MTTLKEGVLRDDPLAAVCKNCAAEVAFHRDEARRLKIEDETVYAVICPTLGCGNSIYGRNVIDAPVEPIEIDAPDSDQQPVMQAGEELYTKQTVRGHLPEKFVKGEDKKDE